MPKRKDDAIENLNKKLKETKAGSIGGALKGGYILLGEAQRHVPVEHGNLRASGYVQKHPNKAKTVQVGFHSEYAFYVHENIEMKLKGKSRRSGIGVYWGPDGEAKFLEKAAVRKRKEILAAIKSNLKGKGKK